FVSGLDLRADVRHFRGDSGSKRVPLRRPKGVPKQSIGIVRRRESSTKGINCGQFQVAVELFAKCEARSPTARRSPVVSKTCGEEILKIVRSGEVAALSEDRNVPVVVMKTCDLELAAAANFSLRLNFFMQTVLQNRMSLAPKQRGEGIQFIESRTERAAWLRVIRLQRTGPVGHGGENKRRTPIVGKSHVQFCPWTE